MEEGRMRQGKKFWLIGLVVVLLVIVLWIMFSQSRGSVTSLGPSSTNGTSTFEENPTLPYWRSNLGGR